MSGPVIAIACAIGPLLILAVVWAVRDQQKARAAALARDNVVGRWT